MDAVTTDRNYSQRAVGIGLALGAGIGATTAVLAEFDLATGAAWGVGGGIVLGALLGRLLDRRTVNDRPTLAWLFGPGLGPVVGGAIGLVGAWSVGADLPAGLLVGAIAGLALGVLLGGILSIDGRRAAEV